MILSDQRLRSLLETGELVIDPILHPGYQVQGAKIDLRLDNIFRVLKSEQIEFYDPLPAPSLDDMPIEIYDDRIIGYQERFILHPGSFALGQTFEFVSMPNNLFGHIEGRSSLGRRGILVHATAGGVDPGYIGVLCLELFNVGRVPVVLHPLMRIASLIFETVDGEVGRTYSKQKDHKFGGYDIRKEWKRDEDFYLIRKGVMNL